MSIQLGFSCISGVGGGAGDCPCPIGLLPLQWYLLRLLRRCTSVGMLGTECFHFLCRKCCNFRRRGICNEGSGRVYAVHIAHMRIDSCLQLQRGDAWRLCHRCRGLRRPWLSEARLAGARTLSASTRGRVTSQAWRAPSWGSAPPPIAQQLLANTAVLLCTAGLGGGTLNQRIHGRGRIHVCAVP